MAKLVDVGSIGFYFESLDDPRHTRNREHLLVDIVVITVCAIICGCDGPTAIHRWAKHRQSWLAQHLALPNGIPSRDCIRRTLIVLKPEAFQRCFQAWISDTIQADSSKRGRLVAIDGKACRGSRDSAKDLGALHIVSAWASEEGIALGQVATDAKSNEITAIPQLLEQIDLKGTLITIDAMGCQKEIVKQVVVGGGDCVIAVKDNQPKLADAIQTFFFDHLESDLRTGAGIFTVWIKDDGSGYLRCGRLIPPGGFIVATTSRKPYPSDLTDAQWAILEPLLPPRVPAGSPRTTDLREVLNAIFYVLTSGCAWSALPHDFPPEGTVRDYFHQWRRSGLLQRIHDTIRDQVRAAAGKEAQPSAGCIDSQTVKATRTSGQRGYDAGKKNQRGQAAYLGGHPRVAAGGRGSRGEHPGP